MSDIALKPIVLSLNKVWQPIGHKTVKDAIIGMCGGVGGHASLGLDISYTRNPDGTYNFDSVEYMNAIPWEEWVKLPIREYDLVISSAHMDIRVPTVTISENYSKMPVHNWKLNKKSLWDRDRGIDQYTGKKLSYSDASMDHVIPTSRGGRNAFDNVVLTHRDVNAFKDDRLPHEAGLTLLRKPVSPAPMPAAATISTARHRDWEHFLINKIK